MASLRRARSAAPVSGSNPCTRAGSKPSKAARKLSRFFRMVIQLSPAAGARALPANTLQVRDPAGLAWLRGARDQGSLIFADLGWDSTGAWSREMIEPLELCYAFLPNADEAMAYPPG